MNARRRSRSPERPQAVGLLVYVAAAVIAGVCLGTYLGKHSGVSGYSAAPAVSPREAAPSASPSRPAEHAGTRRSNEPARTPAIRGPVEPPNAPVREPAQAPLPTRRSPQAPSHPRPRGFEGEIAHTNSTTMVALTFDAGASSKPTSQLLDRLKAAGLKVTFFLTGRWCEQNEALVRRIHDEGHEIANHTYSHPDLRKLEDSAIREEITRTDEIVLRITGDHCAPYLRPPYGARDRRVLRIASEEGYTLIYWSVDSWDAFKKGIMADEIRERVLDRVRGGDIVLMHCGSQATADALPELIRELHTRGLKIVTVTELLRAG